MKIPVYDTNGNETQSVYIDDEIHYINGRVSKGKKCYYKGAGTIYNSHYLDVIDDKSLYNNITKSDVFYLGYKVEKTVYAGKFGIFKECYQPFFSDFIGACGNKEFSIIDHSAFFKRSSVEVIGSVETLPEQYYFKLDYSCGRRKYTDGGNARDLRNLLEYMIAEDWNFIWDKNSIEDISYNGLVSDVADIFHSKELKAKFGTVYSVLYSLWKYPKQHAEFLALFGATTLDVIQNTLTVLRWCDADMGELLPYDLSVTNQKRIIYNYLINGRNCGDCCYVDVGNRVRDGYLKQTIQQIGELEA